MDWTDPCKYLSGNMLATNGSVRFLADKLSALSGADPRNRLHAGRWISGWTPSISGTSGRPKQFGLCLNRLQPKEVPVGQADEPVPPGGVALKHPARAFYSARLSAGHRRFLAREQLTESPDALRAVSKTCLLRRRVGQCIRSACHYGSSEWLMNNSV